MLVGRCCLGSALSGAGLLLTRLIGSPQSSSADDRSALQKKGSSTFLVGSR